MMSLPTTNGANSDDDCEDMIVLFVNVTSYNSMSKSEYTTYELTLLWEMETFCINNCNPSVFVPSEPKLRSITNREFVYCSMILSENVTWLITASSTYNSPSTINNKTYTRIKVTLCKTWAQNCCQVTWCWELLYFYSINWVAIWSLFTRESYKLKILKIAMYKCCWCAIELKWIKDTLWYQAQRSNDKDYGPGNMSFQLQRWCTLYIVLEFFLLLC